LNSAELLNLCLRITTNHKPQTTNHKYRTLLRVVLIALLGSVGNLARAIDTERSVTTAWNLDYIDSRGSSPVQDGYFLSLYTGRGVHIFLMDTGVNVSSGSELANHSSAYKFPCLNTSITGNIGVGLVDDCSLSDVTSHGTHVAAVIGGDTMGVARDVKFYVTKITQGDTRTFLGSNFTQQSLLLAKKIDRIIDYVKNPANAIPANSAIINFSAGFSQNGLSGLDASFEQAVMDARNAGILVVIAAGNDPQKSANNISPGRLGTANGIIDVAAVDINLRATMSDGTVVDMYAPGVNLSTGGASIPTGGGHPVRTTDEFL